MGEPIVAKTRHGELTLDQLAELQPGMARVMDEVAKRYWYTYYAAKGGNWPLAAHHLSELRGAFRIAKLTRPKYAADLTAFEDEYLTPVQQAIQQRDWEMFERAYRRGIEGSDRYHDKYGFTWIRYTLPAHPPEHLSQGAPELFRRKSAPSPA